MQNPFDVIDARLSNIENLLLDIKHGYRDGKPPIVAASHENISIDDLGLSVRNYNVLRSMSVKTLMDITELTKNKLYSQRGFGRKCYNELVETLLQYGVTLKAK